MYFACASNKDFDVIVRSLGLYILKQKSNVRFSWYCIYQSS